jgi:hypothetical protein
LWLFTYADGPESQEHFLLITPMCRAAVAVTALAAALLLGACDAAGDDPADRSDTAPVSVGASPSACPPGPSAAPSGMTPGGGPSAMPSDAVLGPDNIGVPHGSGGPGADCGPPPDGSGGGSQLYPDIDPSNFTPRGTDLWGHSSGSPSGAPGDVLAPFGATPDE